MSVSFGIGNRACPPRAPGLGPVARFAPPAIVVFAAVAAYLPVIVVPYAFEDDYWILGAAHGLGGANVWKSATAGGRPIQGLLLTGIFSLVPDLESLRLVRVLGLVGAVLVGLLLFFALRRSGLNRWFAAAVSLTIITLPSFQVYVSWAVLFEAPYAGILAGLAWLRLSTAFGMNSRAALARWAEATTLLLCGLFTYQPAAMLFWVFAAIDLLRPAQPLAHAARKFAAGLGVAIVALGTSFVVVKVGVHFYGGLGAGRTSLNHDLVGKLRWFWSQPLVNTLNLFELTPRWALAAGVAGLAAVGILLLHAEQRREALGFLGIALALVPLSYLPNLVVAENWASYRSVGALSALLLLYTWLGLWGIARAALTLRARSRAELVARRIVALALAVPLSFLSLAVVLVPLSHLPTAPAAPGASIGTLGESQRLAPFVLLVAAFAGLGLWITSSSLSNRATLVAFSGAAVGAAVLALTGVLLAARNVTTLFAKPESREVQMLRSTLDRPSASSVEQVVFIKPNWDQGAAPLVRYDEFGLPSTYAGWVPNPAVLLLLREQRRPAPSVIEVLAWDEAPARNRAESRALVVDMRRLQQRPVGWSLWSLHTAAR